MLVASFQCPTFFEKPLRRRGLFDCEPNRLVRNPWDQKRFQHFLNLISPIPKVSIAPYPNGWWKVWEKVRVFWLTARSPSLVAAPNLSFPQASMQHSDMVPTHWNPSWVTSPLSPSNSNLPSLIWNADFSSSWCSCLLVMLRMGFEYVGFSVNFAISTSLTSAVFSNHRLAISTRSGQLCMNPTSNTKTSSCFHSGACRWPSNLGLCHFPICLTKPDILLWISSSKTCPNTIKKILHGVANWINKNWTKAFVERRRCNLHNPGRFSFIDAEVRISGEHMLSKQ